jgi:hypothetical protein
MRRDQIMKLAIKVILLLTTIGLPAVYLDGQMALKENTEQAALTVYDGENAVLTYRFGEQLTEGADPKYTRSCYIHPLFALDGQIVTEDFPKDHPHHSGLFWTWPLIKTRGQETQTWHMHLSQLRQYFFRWLKRDITKNKAVISVENVWKLKGQEIVAREAVTIRVHSNENDSRAIDLELKIQAIGGPLELQGTPEQGKGYGGLSLRGGPMFKGGVLTTDQGLVEKDIDDTPYKWADLSATVDSQALGIAIFVAPGHPGSPVHWTLRNSYAGFLNPAWPGIKSISINPGYPVILRYRIYLHRGDADTGLVAQAYRQYLTEISH